MTYLCAPYTYLIGWSALDKYYYGVRYAKNCNPLDLWVKYFTSSKKVKEYRSIYGDPDIVQIRKTFNSIDEARLWEHKVLKRLDVINSDKWLNNTNNISFSYEISIAASKKAAELKRGQSHSDDHKLKIAEALKGRSRDPAIAIKTQNTKIAKKKENPNYKIGVHPKGFVFSDDYKKKLSDAALKRASNKILCPYCNNTFNDVNYNRWHGINCKQFKYGE